MLEKSVVEDCCTEVVEKRVVGKCWRRLLERVLEKSVGEECCREVLGRSVERSLVGKCWGRVLKSRVG